MNAVFTPSLFNFVSVFVLIVSVVTLVLSTEYLMKKEFVMELNQGDESISIKDKDIKQQSEKLLNKERRIADLRIKLELKKFYEEELIKTISEVETNENFNSKILVSKLKQKLINLGNFDRKQLTKNSSALDENSFFQKELQRLHPELSFQERMLCSYFRLHLSARDIGEMEGITNGTVRVYKTKIKYKMKLTHEESLNQYLCNLKENKAA